ncbi:hypothetical protein J4467_00950 [Candidatus Woesearchaeota archaeon]|nr:hypothetical protein [Candidatus Woesearchaeota archaeon]
MAQTQSTAPNYTKYTTIEDIIFDRQEKHVRGLENALVIAYGSHLSQVPEAGNQGDGLIEKLYNAADVYIREKHMGGKMPEDPDQRRIIESTIQKMIGFDPSDERYKGKKSIDFQEIAPLIGRTKKGYGEFFEEQFQNAVQLIPESEFELFRGYVLKRAQELGLDIKKDDLPRMSWLKNVYMNRIRAKLASKHDAEKTDRMMVEELERNNRATSP